jgi:hypothetical protein
MLHSEPCRLIEGCEHVGTHAEKYVLLEERHRTLFYGERGGRVL